MNWRCPKLRIADLVLVLLVGTVAVNARASELTPGNILVSVSSSIDRTLREYTPGGALIQSTAVPYPVSPIPGGEKLRDVVVTPAGLPAIYNGTFSPYMTLWDPAADTYTHTTYEGWSTYNLDSYGGIAAWGDYVYASDVDAQSGLVRFNTADGTAGHFYDLQELVDVTVGFDGLLYAMHEVGGVVFVIDPETMATVRGFTLNRPCNGIAVDGDGNVFGASGDGNIYKFSPYGALLDTLDPNEGSLIDIDVDAQGRLVVGTRLGWVLMTDNTLSSFTIFQASTNFDSVFVSFTTPVPEPGTAITILLLATSAIRRRTES